jgi:hypothetical protein
MKFRSVDAWVFDFLEVIYENQGKCFGCDSFWLKELEVTISGIMSVPQK